MQWTLVVFGWLFIAIVFMTIAIPYLRGRSDLLTTWNLFLLGSANFVGFASVQAGHNSVHKADLRNSDYVCFVAGAIIFYATIYFAYYVLRYPRRAAGRRLNRWPSPSNGVLVLMSLLCMILGVGTVFTPGVQGLGQILSIAGRAAAVFAAVYVFVLWYRRPANVAYLCLWSGVTVYAAFVALVNQSGRRALLSLALSFVICAYWLHLRYKPARSTLLKLSTVGVMLFVVVAAYSSIRFRDKRAGYTASYTLESVKMLPSALLGLDGPVGVLGGDTTEISLLAINRYTEVASPQPFWSLWFIITNPVPRAIWGEGKPEALGHFLPGDVGQWRFGYVNWGPGIVGHGFHEGGLHMLVFYGLLFGVAMRFVDELLMRQSDNPYLLGIVGSVSGQIVAFSRGDIGLFLLMILAGFLTGLGVCWLGRMLTGTGLIYPRADEVAMAQMAASMDMGEEFSPSLL